MASLPHTPTQSPESDITRPRSRLQDTTSTVSASPPSAAAKVTSRRGTPAKKSKKGKDKASDTFEEGEEFEDGMPKDIAPDLMSDAALWHAYIQHEARIEPLLQDAEMCRRIGVGYQLQFAGQGDWSLDAPSMPPAEVLRRAYHEFQDAQRLDSVIDTFAFHSWFLRKSAGLSSTEDMVVISKPSVDERKARGESPFRPDAAVATQGGATSSEQATSFGSSMANTATDAEGRPQSLAARLNLPRLAPETPLDPALKARFDAYKAGGFRFF